jgi:hypothetical protein
MNILDPAGSIHDAATPACIQQSQPNPDQSRVSSFRLSIHFFKLLIYFNNIIWFDLEQVQRSSISRLRDVSFAGTPPPPPPSGSYELAIVSRRDSGSSCSNATVSAPTPLYDSAPQDDDAGRSLRRGESERPAVVCQAAIVCPLPPMVRGASTSD